METKKLKDRVTETKRQRMKTDSARETEPPKKTQIEGYSKIIKE